MNEELQATLEWLKDCGEHDWFFETGNSKMLLDYITNLKHIEDLYNQLLKDYDELQQENEYLKKHQRFHKKFGNDYIFCAEGDKETYKDLLLEKQEELEDYKLRIEKAVEYVNHNKQKTIGAYGDNEDDDFEICLWEEDIDNLLNILNGKE